ncbi:MAG: hypothetical protein U1A77_25570 [Pirellulales bacterium]
MDALLMGRAWAAGFVCLPAWVGPENWLQLPGRFGTIPQGGFAVERSLAQRRPNKALNPSGGPGRF